MCGDFPKQWSIQLPLAEYWYNTKFHAATKVIQFEVVYGHAPSLHMPCLLGNSVVEVVDRILAAREIVLHHLKYNLHKAQNRMKQQADQHRSNRQYQARDWVYVKLQLQRQHSLKVHSCQKLASKFFGPFQVIKRVHPVAYQLQLPNMAKIHSIFYVSLLKKKVGTHQLPHTFLLQSIHNQYTGIIINGAYSHT